MKKFVKMLICGVIAVITGISSLFAAGCGGGQPDNEYDVEIDPNKKTVYVSLFNGGFGEAWIQEAAKRFNEKNTKTQIVIEPNKNNYAVIEGELKSGLSQYDIYVTNDTMCITYAIQDLIEDISDVWAMIPEAEGETRTVRDKMIDSDDFAAAYSYNGKQYGIPISDGIHGFIYDHDLFVQEGFLMTDGNGKVTLGKDGKAGTYDDGLPVNMAEWDLMVQKIVANGIYPFSWTGAAANDYLIPLGETVFAQYEGLNNYRIASSFKGTYKNPVTKAETVITPKDGWKTYSLMEGRKLAAKFMKDYLFTNPAYYTPNSTKQGTTYTLAHDYFILGYKGKASNPRAAMLYEGVWWENESRTTFSACKEPGYGYGERDFRFMPLPAFENQVGANGDGTGSIVAASETGTAFIRKQNDPEKLDAAKRFLAYTCSDEMLRFYTKTTGAPKPYDYDLTAEDLNAMTKFSRSAWEMYSDKENIKIARYQALNAASPMFYLASPPASRWQSQAADGKISLSLFSAVDFGIGAEDYFAGMSRYMPQSKWTESYDKIKDLYE